MRIEYAVMISDPQGSAINSSTWGIYSGAMCYVTGRPAWTTATPPTTGPLNPNSLINQLDWAQGMFLMGKFTFPSYSIDLEEMGTYGTTSGMKVDLQNVTGLFFALRDLGFTLYRCRVQFFVVIEGVFIQWWQGLVGDVAFNGSTLSLDCVDYFKDMHGQVPPEKVDATDYPRAKDSVIGKVVPACIGYVTHARLLNVGGKSTPMDCIQISGIKHKTCPLLAYTAPALPHTSTPVYTLTISVLDLAVGVNEWAGKWIIPIKGGPREPVKIVSNTATTAYQVTLVVDRFWTSGDAGAIIVPQVYHSSNSFLDEWWMQIIDASFPRIVSDKAVSSIELNPGGVSRYLEAYDKDAESWIDISDATHKVSETNIEQGNGKPGFLIFSKDLEETKSKNKTMKMFKPSSAILIGFEWAHSNDVYGTTADANYLTISGNTATGAVPALCDMNRATEITWTLTRGSSLTATAFPMRTKATFDLFFDAQIFNSGYDSLSAQIRAKISSSGPWKNPTIIIAMATIYGIDILGNRTMEANKIKKSLYSVDTLGVFFQESFAASPSRTIDGIPLPYFEDYSVIGGQDVKNQNSILQFDSLLGAAKDFASFKGVRIELEFWIDLDAAAWSPGGNTAMRFDITDVALSGNGEADIAPEEAATRAIGQMYSDDWDASRTIGDPVTNIADVPAYLMREYDGMPWLVDAASVDAVKALRPDSVWSVGRQLFDASKSSAELIESACKEGWFAIAPTSTGQRRQMAWTEAATSFDFDATNIVPDSIGTAVATPLRKVYTEFDINYNFDPGPNKRTRNITIRRTDEAFPAETTFEGSYATVAQTAYWYSPDGAFPTIRFQFATELVKVGDYVSFVGTDPGNELVFAPRIVLTSHYFEGYWYCSVDGAGGTVLSDYAIYTLGTLSLHEAHSPAWKDFVSGVYLYSDAAALHNSVAYPLTRTKNVLKLDMDWAFEWSDWGGSSGNNLPLQWLATGVPWLSKPKYRIPFKIPINSTTLALYPGQCVTFTDSVATNGDTLTGWIQRLNLRPGAIGKDNVIDVEIIYVLD